MLVDDVSAAYAAPAAATLSSTSFYGCASTVIASAGTSATAGAGGGIYMVAQRGSTANLTLTSGTSFTSGAATSGAGVFLSGPVAMFVSSSSFTNNAAQTSAGAIQLSVLNQRGPTASLVNCTVANNTGGSAGVAAIYASSATVTAMNTSFTGNSAQQGSGAVTLASYSTASFYGCLFSGNGVVVSTQANALNTKGAAVYVTSSSSVLLSNCALTSNTVSGYGGALAADGAGLVNISNSVLTGNSAYQGGAVYHANSPVWVSGSSLTSNTAQAGGALSMSGGSLSVSSTLQANNSASGASAQGGCMLVDDVSAAFAAPTAVTLANASFLNCTLQVSRPVLNSPGTSYVTAFGSGSGGGAYMISQRGTTANVALTSGTSFTGGVATNGAGMFLYGPFAVTMSNCSFTSNYAQAAGGAVHYQVAGTPSLPASIAVASSTFNQNSAYSGGGFYLYSGTVFSAVASSFNNNTAQTGGVLSLRVAGQTGAPPVLTLQNITAVANTALSGALTYHDSPVALPAPACGNCTVSNVQTNANATPFVFRPVPPSVGAPSGELLPPVNITLVDSDGNLVKEWPGVVVSISAGSFTGLSGTLLAPYSSGSATFSTLAVSDLINVNHTLTYSVSAPSLPNLDGATGTFIATTQPCPPLKVFDAATLRCKCIAGTFLDLATQTCASCSVGSYSPTPGALGACMQCPAGSFSDLNFTACTPCAAGFALNPSTLACQTCLPGNFASSAGSTSCMPCAPGSYSDLNFTTCTQCLPGTYLNVSAQLCQSCMPGSFSAAGAVSCTPCAPGSYSSASFTQCTPCAAGTYLDVVSQRCKSCLPGSFSAAGATACTSCAPGSYSDLNFTTCTQCQPGAFLNVSAQQCQSCLPGFFSASGAVSCTPCTPGSYSSASFTQCTPCPSGTFLNASSQACQTCPIGTYNPTAGAVACTVNPTGFTSTPATNFSTNVTLDVPPGSFGAAQATAATASIAAVVGVEAGSVSVAALASDGGSSRRRLWQQTGLTLAVVVATEGTAAASRVRSVVAAPDSFGAALVTHLQSSGDPVLSSVSTVAATPPSEATVTQAAHACLPVRARAGHPNLRVLLYSARCHVL